MNHQLTIDMAKQLCMIQRTELGQMFRKYFIQIEEQWNSPEAVMARALQFVNKKLAVVEKENLELLNALALQSQQIDEMKTKVSYYDVVINCKELISMRAIAKDYGKSAQWINNFLHDLGVQFKQSDIWPLYQKYADMYTFDTMPCALWCRKVPKIKAFSRFGRYAESLLFVYDFF